MKNESSSADEFRPERGAPLRSGPVRRETGGFSMIELTLVMGVVMLAFLALSRSLGESMQLSETTEETARATDAAREMAELLDGVEEFSQVFALYNDWDGDDPGGPGSAPGPGFAVPGLSPRQNDPDQLVGEIVFPALPGIGGKPELAEDFVAPQLGMPRDLDGLNGIDTADHSTDYRLLPVTLRLEWDGSNGPRMLEVHMLLADR